MDGKILIVDDEESTRRGLRKMLSLAGMMAAEIPSGDIFDMPQYQPLHPESREHRKCLVDTCTEYANYNGVCSAKHLRLLKQQQRSRR